MRALLSVVNSSARYPVPMLVFLGILTLLFGLAASKIGINASPYVVDISHPTRQHHEALKQTFTNAGEQVMIVLLFPDTVFTAERLKKVDDLTQAIEQVSLLTGQDEAFLAGLAQDPLHGGTVTSILQNGVAQSDLGALRLLRQALFASSDHRIEMLDQLLLRLAPIERVRSLTTVEDLAEVNDELLAERLVERLPVSLEDAQSLQEKTTENPLFQRLLVDMNGKATNVQVEFRITGDDSPNMILAYRAIQTIVEAEGLKEHAYYSGVPVINAEIAGVVDSDNKKFFPVVILVILLVLYLTFRRGRVVLLSLAVAIVTTLWTLGTMALLGVDQNIVTAVLPIFIISISVSDAIHFMTAYLHETKGTHREAIRAVGRELILPMFLTSVTTVFGFLSLAYSNLVFITEFGLSVALSVVYAFLVTITLLPACSVWMRRYAPGQENQRLPAFFVRLSRDAARRPGLWCAVILVLAVASIAVASHLRVDNHSSDAFAEDSPLRHDADIITQHLGGIYPVNFWFSSKEERGLLDPRAIEAMEAITTKLLSYSQVGRVISPNDFIKRINQVITGADYALPTPLSQDVVAQLLFLYENSNGQELRDVMDGNYENGRLVALFKTDRASDFRDVIEEVRQLAGKTLPPGVTLTITGYGAEIVVATEEVVYGQIYSTIIACVLIFLLLSFYYRSWLVAALGMIPLFLTIAMIFSSMALTGVYLDIGTALIIGITFGIGIDYTIHFVSFLKLNLGKGHDWEEAIAATLAVVSRPITSNSIALSLGFLVLALSSFKPLQQLGYFVSGSMLLCATISLVILPLVFGYLKPAALAPDASQEQKNDETPGLQAQPTQL